MAISRFYINQKNPVRFIEVREYADGKVSFAPFTLTITPHSVVKNWTGAGIGKLCKRRYTRITKRSLASVLDGYVECDMESAPLDVRTAVYSKNNYAVIR